MAVTILVKKSKGKKATASRPLSSKGYYFKAWRTRITAEVAHSEPKGQRLFPDA